MTKRFDAGQDSVQPSMRMKARTFNTVGVSMAVLGAAMIGMPALAQDADDAESTARRLGTVTVTARKVEENLQEVPVAVTAFTGAELAARSRTMSLRRLTHLWAPMSTVITGRVPMVSILIFSMSKVCRS